MVLTYSEMQAIASGNPMIKEKIQLDNDVAMLKTLEAEHKKSIYKMQELAEKTLPKQITHYSELLAKSKSDMSKYQEQQALNKEFEMTIGGVRYDKRENAGEQIAVAMAKCTATGEPIELGTYRGFKVTIERNPSANTFLSLIRLVSLFSTESLLIHVTLPQIMAWEMSEELKILQEYR